jgi:hypothetical protein
MKIGIEAETAIAPLQAAPPVHAAGVVIDDVTGALADERVRLAGQSGVRNSHLGLNQPGE